MHYFDLLYVKKLNSMLIKREDTNQRWDFDWEMGRDFRIPDQIGFAEGLLVTLGNPWYLGNDYCI